MMKRKFTMTLLCASMIAMTGCNDDETIYKPDPNIESKLQKLTDENGALTTRNSQLTTTNSQLLENNQRLTTEVNDLKNSPTIQAHDFISQCKIIGTDFDFVNPNADVNEVNTAAIQTLAVSTDCKSCHGASNPPPHADYGDCKNCHEGHADTPEPELPTGGPTLPTFAQPAFLPGVIDGKTGASGSTFYTPGSYLNAQWLYRQLNAQFHIYRWKEVSTGGVIKLEEACQLAQRQHMVDMFPNDGKAYEIEHKNNAIGAKSIATVNKFQEDGKAVETPNIATFGYGLKEIDGAYFVTMNIGKGNTCHNIIMNGEARLSYYEYDPAQVEKTGLAIPSRNRGARIIAKTDYERTGLLSADWATAVPGLGVGETFKPEDVKWEDVGACNLMLKIENIIPLG